MSSHQELEVVVTVAVPLSTLGTVTITRGLMGKVYWGMMGRLLIGMRRTWVGAMVEASGSWTLGRTAKGGTSWGLGCWVVTIGVTEVVGLVMRCCKAENWEVGRTWAVGMAEMGVIRCLIPGMVTTCPLEPAMETWAKVGFAASVGVVVRMTASPEVSSLTLDARLVAVEDAGWVKMEGTIEGRRSVREGRKEVTTEGAEVFSVPTTDCSALESTVSTAKGEEKNLMDLWPIWQWWQALTLRLSHQARQRGLLHSGLLWWPLLLLLLLTLSNSLLQDLRHVLLRRRIPWTRDPILWGNSRCRLWVGGGEIGWGIESGHLLSNLRRHWRRTRTIRESSVWEDSWAYLAFWLQEFWSLVSG